MERYLVHSIHDDHGALLVDVGLRPSSWQSFLSTAGMVTVIDGAIAGAFAGVVAKAVVGLTIGLSAILGILVFAASVLLFRRYHVRAWTAAEQGLVVLFPSPPDPRETTEG
jgi:hypothetical protein